MVDLRVEPSHISAMDIGSENPLPRFRWMWERRIFKIADDVPEEDRKYIGWETDDRCLPYRLQDDFGGRPADHALESIVLENDILKATFLPGLGGRLWSLFHKPDSRELLHQPSCIRVANIALRGAWFCGGVEWNVGQFGHGFLTSSPVFAARVAGPNDEPILRLYEWDRAKCFPWQIDFHLPTGSSFLFAHMRVVNPHDAEIPMYWWTNIAVPETPRTRMLGPSDTVLTNGSDGSIDYAILPGKGKDGTYPQNKGMANECFYRVPKGSRPWVAAVEGDGKGMIHSATERLVGCKAFFWGMTPGGRHWQEFLNGDNRAYIELQAGLARTQMEHVPMPSRTAWHWTEVFGPIECDPQKVHTQTWSDAWHTVQAQLEQALPESRVHDLDERLNKISARSVEEVLFTGGGWGALERRRIRQSGQEDRVPRELVFEPDSMGPEQEPWLALVQDGILPETHPKEDIPAWMVQKEWLRLLEESVLSEAGDHWLTWLHIGNAYSEQLDLKKAEECWEQSLARRESAWALRNLALLAKHKERFEEAVDLLQRAWTFGPQVVSLALEYAQALQKAGRHDALHEFLAGLSPEIREHEHAIIMMAQAALQVGDYEDAEALIDRDFSTVREGDNVISDIWFEAQAVRAAKKRGVALTSELRKEIRTTAEPPRHMDFRMFG